MCVCVCVCVCVSRLNSLYVCGTPEFCVCVMPGLCVCSPRFLCSHALRTKPRASALQGRAVQWCLALVLVVVVTTGCERRCSAPLLRAVVPKIVQLAPSCTRFAQCDAARLFVFLAWRAYADIAGGRALQSLFPPTFMPRALWLSW